MSRREVLEQGIERLARLLEVENTLAHGFQTHAVDNNTKKYQTGIGWLFSQSAGISSKIVEPYEHFYKGVWAGFEPLEGACRAVLSFEPKRKEDRQAGDIKAYAPSFTLHPVFAGKKVSRWMTLETDVDPQLINLSGTIKLNLIADFMFMDLQQAVHTNTVQATLRHKSEDGSETDIDLGSFPVTTVPMAHTLTCVPQAFTNSLKANQDNLKLILWLPTHGAYNFHLYALSVEGE